VEEVLVHKIMIALDIVPLHRIVFIQIEGDHILETEALLPMHTDELLIYPDGGRTCRKTKYTGLPFFRFPSDQCRNFPGHFQRSFLGVVKDDIVYLFKTSLFKLS